MGVLILVIVVAAVIWLMRDKTAATSVTTKIFDGGGNALPTMLQAIGDFEKSGYARNNPGNLRPSKPLPGQVGTSPGGFAIGDSPETGMGWLSDLVTRRAGQHPEWDFYDFFNYYLRGSTTAPSIDDQGNSDSYAEFVAGRLGVDPTTPIGEVFG